MRKGLVVRVGGSSVRSRRVEFLGDDTPNDETDALPVTLPTIQATVDLKTLAADHQAALNNEPSAKTAHTDAGPRRISDEDVVAVRCR